MNFGNWILVAFVLFAAFVITLVVITYKQDISLVSNDYYARELVYQDQINRVKNADALDERPYVTLAKAGIELHYSRLSSVTEGRIELFRPSDAKLDRLFTFHQVPLETAQFEVPELTRGLYRVHIFWKMNGREYFTEQQIHVQ